MRYLLTCRDVQRSDGLCVVHGDTHRRGIVIVKEDQSHDIEGSDGTCERANLTPIGVFGNIYLSCFEVLSGRGLANVEGREKDTHPRRVSLVDLCSLSRCRNIWPRKCSGHGALSVVANAGRISERLIELKEPVWSRRISQ